MFEVPVSPQIDAPLSPLPDWSYGAALPFPAEIVPLLTVKEEQLACPLVPPTPLPVWEPFVPVPMFEVPVSPQIDPTLPAWPYDVVPPFPAEIIPLSVKAVPYSFINILINSTVTIVNVDTINIKLFDLLNIWILWN